MKSKLFFIGCLLGMVFAISCEQDPMIIPELQSNVRDPESGANGRKEDLAMISKGTVVSVQFYSPSLEGNLLGDLADRAVNVYLPKSYYSFPDKRFPVIYYLHGMPASENSLKDPEAFWMLNYVANLSTPVDFPEEGFTAWINDLIDNGGMKETIVFMADAANFYGLSF